MTQWIPPRDTPFEPRWRSSSWKEYLLRRLRGMGPASEDSMYAPENPATGEWEGSDMDLMTQEQAGNPGAPTDPFSMPEQAPQDPNEMRRMMLLQRLRSMSGGMAGGLGPR